MMNKTSTPLSTELKSSVDVYISRIPSDLVISPVTPPSRDDEIRTTANLKLKAQRYTAWKTLEAAARNSFGKELSELSLKKEVGGKWTCEDFCFSITHTDGAVAVAVSKSPVGIDMENLTQRLKNHPDMPEKLWKKVLMEREARSVSPHRFYAYWTRKESLFKALDNPPMSPSLIETSSPDAPITTASIVLGDTYVLSVAYPTDGLASPDGPFSVPALVASSPAVPSPDFAPNSALAPLADIRFFTTTTDEILLLPPETIGFMNDL